MQVPERMKRFPLWLGRYPIHYTVMVENGVPQFNQVSRGKQIQAARKNLCHLCGQRMSAPYWFLCGETDVEQKATKDGPMHEECARYAIVICPFLANPHYVGKVPAVKGQGPSTVKALIEMGATGPVVRPPKIALCTADSYMSDLKPQYPIFVVGQWTSVDWSAVPSREEVVCA